MLSLPSFRPRPLQIFCWSIVVFGSIFIVLLALRAVSIQFFYILIKFLKKPGDYSVVLKDFAIDAESLGLNSQAGQVGHSVANGSQPLRRFFEAALPRR